MLSKKDKDAIILFPIGAFEARNPKELQFAIEVLIYNFVEKRRANGEFFPVDVHSLFMKTAGVLDTVKHRLQEEKIRPFEKQAEFDANMGNEE